MTFNRPARLQSTYPDLRITGREKVGGDRGRRRDRHQRPRTHQLYFSESGVLLVRRGDRIETPLGAAPEFYDFSGFERVDGVMMPKKDRAVARRQSGHIRGHPNRAEVRNSLL